MDSHLQTLQKPSYLLSIELNPDTNEEAASLTPTNCTLPPVNGVTPLRFYLVPNVDTNQCTRKSMSNGITFYFDKQDKCLRLIEIPGAIVPNMFLTNPDGTSKLQLKPQYDAEVTALYVRIGEGKPTGPTLSWHDTVMFDCNAAGHILGMEILFGGKVVRLPSNIPAK
jgi:uncharacterized protein YuzE